MAELLVFARAGEPEGRYQKGEIVVVQDNGWSWGSGERPPDFVLVKVPSVSLATAQQYIAEWRTKLSFSVIASDPSIDGFRLSVSNENVSNSGNAALTRSQVETFLNNWNASVVSVAANSVTFDVKIFDALTSNGFWGRNVSQVVFTEQAYEQASGGHTIRADYSVLPVGAEEVAELVLFRGGVVVSNESGVITYQMNRADARVRFQADVAQAVERLFKRRRFAFLPADVDTALANGGTVTLTAAQAQNKIKDGFAA